MLIAMKVTLKLQACVFSIVIPTVFVSVTAQINLALYGTVTQESTYVDGNGTSFEANLAIEGPANNDWKGGCSSTAANEPTQWWGLLLPKLAYITNVKIFLRNDAARRMNGFRLYFANGSLYYKTEKCFDDFKHEAYRNLNQSIDCDLSPTKNVYFFNRYAFIELCYIEISGCWKGTWGTNCTTDCPDECTDRHCYPQNGSCIWGCDEQKCPHGKCDAKTAVCTKGCIPGRGGRYCTFYNMVYNITAKLSLTVSSSAANALTDGNTTSCISIVSTSSNSYIQIGNESLIVITGMYLFFGDNTTIAGNHKVYCSNTTDSWADGTVLYNAEYYNEDIDVFAVCKYVIYLPPILNGNSKMDICEIEIGGCPYGKYGDRCESICPDHCIGSCDLRTGNCVLGCSSGWLGEKCDRACDGGQFGNQCLRDCSSNCLSPPCDHVTGQCTAGCMKGWKGLNCTEECVTGHFGFNCAYSCDTCFNQSCDIFEGNCRVGCNDGYRGRKCDMPVFCSVSSESSAIIRFGFFIGGIASMCIVLLIIWMVKNARRRIIKKQENRQATDNSHSNSNEQHYGDIMKMESVSTYQDLTKETITVSNDYDQINNSYMYVNQ